MFDETPQALPAAADPLLWLGLELDEERRALKKRRIVWPARRRRYRPAWRQAVIAQAGAPIATDANGTLRVTFGRVKGTRRETG